MRALRAVIFDRDGVLTHFDLPLLRESLGPLVPLSLAEIGARWQRWCQRGGPRTAEEEAAFWAEFWDAICRELQLDEGVRQRLHAFDYTRAVRPFPDASVALMEARERRLKIGVLSNFPLASLEASLTAAGLYHAVDVALSASVIGAAKPAPASYLAMTEALGLEPEECLFLDDEADCVDGARAVGMRAYLVDRSRGEHALADGVVRGLDVLPLLDPISQREALRR